MGQDNVETVTRIYEDIPNSDPNDPMRALYAPHFELDQSDVAPDGDVAVGFEAADAAIREYWATFEDFSVKLEEVIHADEEQVVTRVRDGGRGQGRPPPQGSCRSPRAKSGSRPIDRPMPASFPLCLLRLSATSALICVLSARLGSRTMILQIIRP